MDENSGLDTQQPGEEVIEDIQDIPGGEEDSVAGLAEDSENTEQDKDDPYSVKKRLGKQAKKHQREMRQLKDELSYLRTQLGSGGYENSQPLNPYTQAPIEPGSNEEQIHKAVLHALNMQKAEQAQAQEAQKLQYVHQQLGRFSDKLDQGSDKYDDFDEVVRGNDVPFTESIRDAAAHLLPFDNAEDVLYKLGKNREELRRISKLHPIDQAREVIKLSTALGGVNPQGNKMTPKTMSEIKESGLGSRASTGNKSSVSDIRNRMKSGNWR